MISLARWYEGKSLLVTGATGFLAKALLAKILKDLRGVPRVLLLIRPRLQAGRTIGVEERLEREILASSAFRALRNEYGDRFQAEVADRITPVSGDLGKEDLGLAEEDLPLLEGLGAIINSAATVVFDERLDLALAVNAQSPDRLRRLAARLGHIPLLHVSTAFVSGMAPGTIPEAEPQTESTPSHSMGQAVLPPFDLQQEFETTRRLCEEATKKTEPSALGQTLVRLGMDRAAELGWNDTYTYTKSLGERLLVRDRGPTPVAILRPAIIESALSEPESGWIDGLRMGDPIFAGYGKGLLRSFPFDPDGLVDFVPVDHVANACLVALARLGEAPPGEGEEVPVYQIATSTRNPLLFEKALELTRDYFLSHPLTSRDGSAILPASNPRRSVEAFNARLARTSKALDLSVSALRRVPGRAASRLRIRCARLRGRVERIQYYADVYGPYCRFAARFDTSHSAELLAQLSGDEARAFDFDPSSFTWESYLRDIHLPGLVRNVLRAAGPAPKFGGAEFPPEGAASGRTVFDLLREAAREHDVRPAVRIVREDGELSLSYRRLLAEALGAASLLKAAGVKPGDRVVLQGVNGPEWVVAWFGIVAAGAVAVPLDAQTDVERRREVVDFTSASASLVSAEILDTQFEGRPAREGVSGETQLALESLVGHALDEKAASDQGLPVELSAESAASILFTSGTTLDPKGVILPHRAFLANVGSVLPIIGPSGDDAVVSVLPLHHAFEFTAGLLTPLSAGATITYVTSLSGPVIVAALKEAQATILLGVPRLFEIVLDGVHRKIEELPPTKGNVVSALRGASKALSAVGLPAARRLLAPIHAGFGGRLRLLVSGGAALDPRVMRGFTELGFTIVEGYGLTEAAPVLCVSPLVGGKPGSVGPSLPGVELRIHRPGKDGIGEVLARGANIMAGYYENPSATARAFLGGWLRTGDLGFLDGDGHLHVTGRLKELIVTSSGKNVYPDEIEAAMSGLKGVLEVSVVGVRARAGVGEEVHLVAVMEAGASKAARTAVREEVGRRMAKLPTHQHIQRIHFWTQQLPKTALQKVQRSKVKERLEGEEVASAANGADWLDEAPVVAEMMTLLARLTRHPQESLRPEQHLSFDLGVDSLMLAEIVASVTAHGKAAPLPEGTELTTVQDLLELARTEGQGGDGDAARDKADEASKKPGFATTALTQTTVPLVRAASPLLYRSYLGFTVSGRQHLPTEGAFILAANHQSHLDAGAILTALGPLSRRLHVVAARDYFFDTQFKSSFFRELLNAIPFDRDGDHGPGLAACREALRSGAPLLIFPEGTRSPNGDLQTFKTGLGLLTSEQNVPIIPALIDGTFEALPKGSRLPRRRPVSVTFGEAFDPASVEVEEGAPAYERYRLIVEAVRQSIVKLADADPSPVG